MGGTPVGAPSLNLGLLGHTGGGVCVQGMSVSLGNFHKGIPGVKGGEGDGALGGEGHQAGPGEATPQTIHDPALSPDADLSVLSQPPILLVILLNVSLNTLPVLAFRIIYQALQKPGPKVRGGGTHRICGTPAAGA